MLILSCIGIAYGLRTSDHKRWIMYFLLVGGTSLILSFGLNLSIGGWHPFNILRTVIPGFHEFRSPFRFAILFHMTLCLLSAFGVWKLSRSQTVFKHGVALFIVALMVILENLAVPQPLLSYPKIEKQEWVSWLKQEEAHRIVLHVPFPRGQHVSDYEIETVRMLAQFHHRKRLANGYSGYFPAGYSNFQMDMATNFPSAPLICFLIQELKVDTVIIDKSWAIKQQSQLQGFSPFMKPLYEDAHVLIFSLPKDYSGC